jgi:hypothetical protein
VRAVLARLRSVRDAVLQLSPGRALALGLGAALGYAILLGLLHLVPRYDAIVFPLVAALVAGSLGGATRRAQLPAMVAAGVILSLGVLVHLWTTGHEGRSAVLFGIVPYSDAGAFYADAERMLYGLRFEESSRRPLYVAVAGAILRWTGDDLRRLLALQTIAYGASMGYAAWEVLRVYGRTAAILVLAVCYFWVRRFTGFVATEALAFPLGALGFGLLLRTADEARVRVVSAQAGPPWVAVAAFGTATLAISLGLIARPGALLVVPALLLWSAWAFRGRFRAIAAASGAAGLVIALLATRAVTARLSSGATFGDYPTIVYALIHRGELFQAYIDHPELSSVDPALRGHAVFTILLSDVRQDPTLLFLGPLDAFFSFLGGPHGLFSFIWTNPDDHVLENGPLVRRLIAEHGYVGPLMHWVHELGLFSLLNAAVMGLAGGLFALATCVGIVRLVRRARRGTAGPREVLVLAAVFGILASSIFAPTWIGEGMQMDSAVLAFVPLALALAWWKSDAGSEPVREDGAPSLRRIVLVTGGVIAIGALGVTLTCALPLEAERGGCAPGLVSAKLAPSTRTVVRPPSERTPNEASLAQNLEFLVRHNPTLVDSVKAAVRTGDAVEIVYDACVDQTKIVVGSPDLLPPEAAWRMLRFTPETEPMFGRVSAP